MELNEKDADEIFEEIYPEIRMQYDDMVEKGINPLAIFGIYLGIMGQEFQAHATKEDFDAFLKHMMDIQWSNKTIN